MVQQELNEKIARFTELRDFQIFADHAGNYYRMEFTDPRHSQLYIVCDAFHLSLDACFKWVVPKVKFFSLSSDSAGFVASILHTENLHYYQAEAEAPALAFCLAVEKLIDSEEK